MNKLTLSLLLLLPTLLQAHLQVSPFFGNHMVLQQQQEIPVWGTAPPGESVTVTFRNRSVRTLADVGGDWIVRLPAQRPGDPSRLRIETATESIAFEDILVGEVWLASGQSNMEWRLRLVDNGAAEIADAVNYPQLRLLFIPRTSSFEPQATFTATWQIASPETVADFSAVAYFFGRKLWEELGVPIGLIDASWGGTRAEAWTPLPTLESSPLYREAVDQFLQLRKDSSRNADLAAQLEETREAWVAEFTKLTDHPPSPQAKWFDLAATIPGTTSFPSNQQFFSNNRGLVQVRAGVELTESQAHEPGAVIRLGRIDDHDVAWINGVEIGRTGRDATNPRALFREYLVPEGVLRPGDNAVVLQIIDRRQTARFGGDVEEMDIIWPNGDRVALPSQWEKQLVVDMGSRPQLLDPILKNLPSGLYNGMIHPLIPGSIRGVIWYQGESNARRAAQYYSLFPDMIASWRAAWDQEFPFYFVQLANFRARNPQPEEHSWAELRDAQLQTLSVPRTGMAVTIDIGDADDIHPGNKQDVGLRLALWALAETYGKTQPKRSFRSIPLLRSLFREPIAHSGPLLREAHVVGRKIELHFDHSNGGLAASDGGPLTGFAIAGEDGPFQWAEARIDRNRIIVSHPEIAAPRHVRYAWAVNPEANLINAAGLPASPFRTDNRPLTTEKPSE